MPIHIRDLGVVPYEKTWQEMKAFTLSRDKNTIDELWLLEHPPVYTQGQAGKAEHILNPNDIPIIQSDRGGQITFHGPGQLVAYTLVDIDRQKLGIRTFVARLEDILIETLSQFDIQAKRKCKAPGVYINEEKIASIGLRVKNGCTYHGIALNVNMDLSPFLAINPCGYAKLQMTQIQNFIPNIKIATVKEVFTNKYLNIFGR